MGHFTIQLSDGRKGTVRVGKIIKKQFSLNPFRTKKKDKEACFCYIISIEPAAGERAVYHFLKSINGEWIQESRGGFKPSEPDITSRAIQSAIEQYEQQKDQ